jgi:septal ring factor EnvC (AmiA/AmiB activator)
MRSAGRVCSGLVALAVAIGLSALVRAQAVTPRQKALDSRLAALKAEAATLAGEQRTLLGRLRQLQVARETRLVELERTNAALARVGPEVGAAGARVAAIEGELRAATPEIRERLVRTYKLLPIGYERLLLSLDQARSFDRAARVVAVVARRDRARLEQFQRLRQAHQHEVDRLQRERATLETLRSRLQQEEAALAETSSAQGALLKQIRERRETNAQLADELMAARDRLDRSVATLGSGGAPAAGYAAGYTGRPGTAAGLNVTRGGLDWPVTGPIEAGFGREPSGRFGTVIARNGIEIRSTTGTPVRAVQAGRVAFADAFMGFGRVVILDHGAKAYTLYGHLATVDVSKDGRVERGQVIGRVGTTPTGVSSLYFELRVDGRPVDPIQWLKP